MKIDLLNFCLGFLKNGSKLTKTVRLSHNLPWPGFRSVGNSLCVYFSVNIFVFAVCIAQYFTTSWIYHQHPAQ